MALHRVQHHVEAPLEATYQAPIESRFSPLLVAYLPLSCGMDCTIIAACCEKFLLRQRIGCSLLFGHHNYIYFDWALVEISAYIQ